MRREVPNADDEESDGSIGPLKLHEYRVSDLPEDDLPDPPPQISAKASSVIWTCWVGLGGGLVSPYLMLSSGWSHKAILGSPIRLHLQRSRLEYSRRHFAVRTC